MSEFAIVAITLFFTISIILVLLNIFLFNDASEISTAGRAFTCLITFFLLAISFERIGIQNAEEKMYEQIRDDVNIKEHILYKKWLLTHPKGN